MSPKQLQRPGIYWCASLYRVFVGAIADSFLFAEPQKKQKDILLHKVEQEKLLKRLPAVSEQLLALAKDRWRLTITDAVTLLSINRNTVKIHLRQLVNQSYLEQHGSGKATWYSAAK